MQRSNMTYRRSVVDALKRIEAYFTEIAENSDECDREKYQAYAMAALDAQLLLMIR